MNDTAANMTVLLFNGTLELSNDIDTALFQFTGRCADIQLTFSQSSNDLLTALTSKISFMKICWFILKLRGGVEVILLSCSLRA